MRLVGQYIDPLNKNPHVQGIHWRVFGKHYTELAEKLNLFISRDHRGIITVSDENAVLIGSFKSVKASKKFLDEKVSK